MKTSFRHASTATLLTLFLLVTGCSHKARYADDPSIHPDLDVSVAWLKNKKNSIDMRVIFKNQGKYPLTFSGGAMHLNFDGREGYSTSTDFVRTLMPGESDARTLIFRFEQLVGKKGVATFTVDPLYKGGSGDDKNRQQVRRYLRRFELE